jgi:hypothetical protein
MNASVEKACSTTGPESFSGDGGRCCREHGREHEKSSRKSDLSMGYKTSRFQDKIELTSVTTDTRKISGRAMIHVIKAGE